MCDALPSEHREAGLDGAYQQPFQVDARNGPIDPRFTLLQHIDIVTLRSSRRIGLSQL